MTYIVPPPADQAPARSRCGYDSSNDVRGGLPWARRARSLRDARRRAYGQNFLASRAIAAQLVRQAKVGRGDLVLEIGAGNGILTAELARQARRVFAVDTGCVPGPCGGDVTCCCSDRVKAELGGTECYTVTIVIL